MLALLLLTGCPPPPAARPRTRPPARLADLTLEAIPFPLYAGPMFTFRGEYAHLLFHLNLHNRSMRPLTLKRVELTFKRSGKVLRVLTLGHEALAQGLRGVPWIVMRDRKSIAAAHRWQGKLQQAKGDTVIPPNGAVSLPHQYSLVRFSLLPTLIQCRVFYDSGQTTREIVVRTYRQRTRLRLPVKGNWWVMAGHRFDEYHGQAFINSQNFAYDLGRLGPNLSTYQGDRRTNSSFGCHGQPVVAAADGEVVEVHDGVKENTPVGVRPSWRQLLRQPRDIAGNFVVLRHAAGEFSTYAHLRPGVAVRAGSTVRAGDVLGACGNSGNSGEPHLHFQLQDGPDPLQSSGLPARFSDFTIHLGRLRLYVPEGQSSPLPTWLVITSGKADGAVDISRWLKRAR